MESALDENTTALEEIILSDLASRAKAGAEVGSRRRTMNNMTTGGQSSIRRLGLSVRMFRDGDGISMVIRSYIWEGSEAMEEARALI